MTVADGYLALLMLGKFLNRHEDISLSMGERLGILCAQFFHSPFCSYFVLAFGGGLL
jgi:hypothetical protein